MATQYKLCRVCGKQYEACRSRKPNDASFHWREVACSPECGVKYLEAVMEARSLFLAEESSKATDDIEMIEEDISETEEEYDYDHDEEDE